MIDDGDLKSDASPTIAIYGATGFTGRLITRYLANKGHRLRLGARNSSRLQQLVGELKEDAKGPIEYAVAATDAPEQLDALLADISILINCAGPFVDLGKPLVNGAIRNGVHYLDTTGEQDHIRWIADKKDGPAAEQGLILMPACAFEFALGDLGAELAIDRGAQKIVIAYAVEQAKMSQGTKKSLLRSLASPGVAYMAGDYVEERTAAHQFRIPLPDGSIVRGLSVTGGECLTVPRRREVHTVSTCVVSDSALARRAASFIGAVPALAKVLRPLADRLVGLSGDNPHQAQSSPPPFRVILFDPDRGRPHLILRGRDMYQTTAKLIGQAACHLIDHPPTEGGFVGPADLFDPTELLIGADIHIS